MEPIFIKIEGQTFPFVIESINEEGMLVSECRPYWIYSSGYLSENITFKVIRKKKEIEKCQQLLDSRNKHVFPQIPTISKSN